MRGIAPAVGLFFLSPLVAEFLLGNIAIDALPLALFMAPLYGGGAVVVREITRSAGRGWPTMMLLALACALIEEGLVTQSLFNPSYFGFDLLGEAYVPALGMGAWWTLFVLTLHTVWSIPVPIAMVEALFPGRAATPWLGKRGLAVAAVLFVLGAVVNGYLTYQQERFMASAAQLMGTAAAIVAVVFAAFRVDHPRIPLERTAPKPRWIGTLALLAASAFMVARWFLAGWFVVGAYLVLFGATTLAVLRWSRCHDWGPAHRLALAGGALLTYAWHSFIETPIIGSKGTVDVIGNVVFATGAVILLAAAVRTVQAWLKRISAASR